MCAVIGAEDQQRRAFSEFERWYLDTMAAMQIAIDFVEIPMRKNLYFFP